MWVNSMFMFLVMYVSANLFLAVLSALVREPITLRLACPNGMFRWML
jgi:hypothetical protein